MSAEFYRGVAADLDRYAAEADHCEVTLVTPCRRRLPDVLQGAATVWLAARLEESASEIRSASAVMHTAAISARSTAAAIEAAEIAAAAAGAEEAAAVEAAAESEPLAEPALFY